MERGELERSTHGSGARSLSARGAHSCALWGVLNVTPDSFSDGGRFTSSDDAVAAGRQLLSEGADVIDVGGESTRPRGQTYGEGYGDVDPSEELARVLPVVERLVREHGATVSVDTTKAAVAEAAIAAGARYVNDVSMGASEALLRAVAASDSAQLVLMHNRGRGEVVVPHTDYADVVADVLTELLAAVARAVAAGVPRGRIWLDPGIGFAKTADQGFALLGALDSFVATGHRVLVGASRKGLLAQAAPRPDGSLPPPLERVGATAATVTASVLAGVHAVRVHDVAVMRQAMLVALAIERGSARP